MEHMASVKLALGGMRVERLRLMMKLILKDLPEVNADTEPL